MSEEFEEHVERKHQLVSGASSQGEDLILLRLRSQRLCGSRLELPPLPHPAQPRGILLIDGRPFSHQLAVYVCDAVSSVFQWRWQVLSAVLSS